MMQLAVTTAPQGVPADAAGAAPGSLNSILDMVLGRISSFFLPKSYYPSVATTHLRVSHQQCSEIKPC